jgi:serine/threonine protein kinase
LKKIASSMTKQNYRNDPNRLDAYLGKIQKIFKTIGSSIHYLHRQNVVHGNLNLESCGKFEDGWKLTGLIGAQSIGNPMTTLHMDTAAPPEAITFIGKQQQNAQLFETYPVSPGIDIWAFGKLMFEVLVGKPLIPRDTEKHIRNDHRYLTILGCWNEDDLVQAVSMMEDTGNGTLAADLISHCLCKRPEQRPQSMEEVLSHPFWAASSSQRKSSSGNFGSSMKRRFHA